MNYSHDMNYSDEPIFGTAFQKQRDDEFDAAMQMFCSLSRRHPEWIEAFKFFVDLGLLGKPRGWRELAKTLDGLGLIEKVNKDWFEARIAEMEARQFFRD